MRDVIFEGPAPDEKRSVSSCMMVPSVRTWAARGVPLTVALGTLALATIGDYFTTAEIGFTLLYLVPIGLSVWSHGLRAGLVFSGLATISWFAMWVMTVGLNLHPFILAWNLVGEIGIFVAFAVVLDRLRVRLDVVVGERQSAVDQLRHADRLTTVGKLAAGVAHELGTPLNVVAGRASQIASGRTAGDDAKKSAAIIVQQTERMAQIIRSLLAFARRGGLKKAPVDLTTVVLDTVALLEPLAKKQKVAIEVEDAPPLVVPAAAGELQQVLTNLIMNAVQAMPHGGSVRVHLGESRQSGSRQHHRPATVDIHVRDQGTGIAPEVLPHIFDPFFTTKDVGVGTGLGLSVSFGIIRDHGGFIDVTTELGQGTEFIVRLPRIGAADGDR